MPSRASAEASTRRLQGGAVGLLAVSCGGAKIPDVVHHAANVASAIRKESASKHPRAPNHRLWCLKGSSLSRSSGSFIVGRARRLRSLVRRIRELLEVLPRLVWSSEGLLDVGAGHLVVDRGPWLASSWANSSICHICTPPISRSSLRRSVGVLTISSRRVPLCAVDVVVCSQRLMTILQPTIAASCSAPKGNGWPRARLSPINPTHLSHKSHAPRRSTGRADDLHMLARRLFKRRAKRLSAVMPACHSTGNGHGRNRDMVHGGGAAPIRSNQLVGNVI
jgi:hypothetical protein